MAQHSDSVEALAGVSSLIQRMFERRAGELGLSAAQARLLDALRDGAPTINELALRLATDKSSASGLVDRAERRALVRRLPSQIDGRSVRVRLTDRGRELHGHIRERLAADITALLARLPDDDRDALAAYLKILLGD